MGKNKQKKEAAADASPAEEPPAKKHKPSDASAVVADGYSTKDPRKIFVGGVPKVLEDSVVKAHFAKLGEIEAFSFPRNGRGIAMGIAFITYKAVAAATKCLKQHGTKFEGQEIAVKLQDDRPKSAKTKTPAKEGGESKAARRKRKKKEKKKLMLAGSKESKAKPESVKLEVKGEGGGSKQKKKQRREEAKFNSKVEAAQAADEGKPKKKKKVKKPEA